MVLLVEAAAVHPTKHGSASAVAAQKQAATFDAPNKVGGGSMAGGAVLKIRGIEEPASVAAFLVAVLTNRLHTMGAAEEAEPWSMVMWTLMEGAGRTAQR